MNAVAPLAATRASSLRRFFRAVRPAEWVFLAYALYYLLLLVTRAHNAGRLPGDPLPIPRQDMLTAVMAVIAVEQIRRYRATPWPEDSRFAELHWKLLPIVALPALLQALVLLRERSWASTDIPDDRLIQISTSVIYLATQELFAALPLVLGWLGLGLHVKTRNAVVASALVSDAAKSVFSVLRDWAPPVAMVLLYAALPGILDHNPIPDRDAQLMTIDRALFFGHDPHTAIEHLVGPALSTWSAFAYTFYAPLYPLTFAFAFLGASRTEFGAVALGVTLTLTLGFVGYTLVPAIGPAFTHAYTVPLDPTWADEIKNQLLDRYRIPRDCFPSLHTAVTLVLMSSLYRNSRRVFWVLLPIGISIPFACIYLRYHYVIDVVAGVVLGAAVSWASPKIQAAYAARQAA